LRAQLRIPANFHMGMEAESKVDTNNPDRGPLLIISGE
jgi:hypothetical protein